MQKAADALAGVTVAGGRLHLDASGRDTNRDPEKVEARKAQIEADAPLEPLSDDPESDDFSLNFDEFAPDEDEELSRYNMMHPNMMGHLYGMEHLRAGGMQRHFYSGARQRAVMQARLVSSLYSNGVLY